ncbi:hypothetical protein [Arthrobacter livingstonensis]|nr:hypothetical protein [Arthrobacter livingstonensis]
MKLELLATRAGDLSVVAVLAGARRLASDGMSAQEKTMWKEQGR